MGESGHIGEFQAPPIERRFAPVEVDGRNLRGVGIRYGEIARMPFGRETFEPGAFGDVRGLDVRLNVQHVRDRLIARTPQTLALTDGPDALRVLATLPETREADDALTLVRAGVLRGLSLEFRAGHAPIIDGVRTRARAGLLGLGLVDQPAYAGSIRLKRGPSRFDRMATGWPGASRTTWIPSSPTAPRSASGRESARVA